MCYILFTVTTKITLANRNPAILHQLKLFMFTSYNFSLQLSKTALIFYRKGSIYRFLFGMEANPLRNIWYMYTCHNVWLDSNHLSTWCMTTVLQTTVDTILGVVVLGRKLPIEP